jgi:hypothetical protein
MPNKNTFALKKTIISLILLTVFVLLLILLVFAVNGNDKEPSPKSPQEKSTRPIRQEDEFDAQNFYNEIQNGMDLGELNQLAGQAGDCAMTGVYPMPESYPCYWYSNSYIIQVTLSKGEVTKKSINLNTLNPGN